VEDSVQYELLILWDEAREHTEERRFEKAIEIYKYIILMYPDAPEAHECADANLADIYLTLRKTDLSKEHILRALTCNSEKPEYHYILGFVYTLDNDWERSINEFEIALQAKPDNAEYLRGLGWATANAGEKEQGILLLNKALRIQPDDINILTDLAVSYLGVAEFNLARKYARMARKIDPANSQVMGTLWMIDYASHLAHMEEE
jgi:tetratricopeptide (TPR) repeat protein